MKAWAWLAVLAGIVVGSGTMAMAERVQTPAAGPPAVLDGGCQATQTIAVDVVNFAFEPAEFEIGLGTNVVWNNIGPAQHTSTENYMFFDTPVLSLVGKILDPPLWDTGSLQAGNQASTLFCDAGTFEFHCSNHVALMRGTLTVG